MQNPFFETWQTPFGAFPFDRIRPEHYEPAFDEGIRQLEKEIGAIADNPEPPTFTNTIEALERSGRLLDRVDSVFFNLLGVKADDRLMEISQRVSPKLTESSNNIYLNERLFARVQTLYAQRTEMALPTEEARLLENTYESFSRRGAALPAEGKEKYRRLSTELNLLSLAFEQNVLKDKDGFELLLTGAESLEGLPPDIREAARLRAGTKGKKGWLFDLSAPSYRPFMRYAGSRRLREKMYRAYMNIGNHDDGYDNKEIIRKIVNDRLEIARLLGFDNYASYKLTHTMAETPQRVYQLLHKLMEAYRPVAVREYDTLQGFAVGTEKKELVLMPWDWNYYAEKLKDIRFHINDEMTRPYFELNNVREGIFGLANRLYGITFRKNGAIPVYHPEVETYEVYDGNGDFLALLYTDFFPRKGKQSGAWMNTLQEQCRTEEGDDRRPHVIIVMNFPRPAGDRPSLLTIDEVNTFLHEFGHALHGMLSRCSYASLSGTNVYRDFVELPSQLMENWLNEKDFLDRIAVHYRTGERIPEEWIQKLIDAANFHVGYACCRQLGFGFLDMAWHSRIRPFTGDIASFEKEALAQTAIVPEVPGTLMSSGFGHIFSGGYAAGYYSYKWSEVLDADAFSLFKETGVFNEETARSFRRHILEKGNTENPARLYRRFRGKEPDIRALLKRNGIRVSG